MEQLIKMLQTAVQENTLLLVLIALSVLDFGTGTLRAVINKQVSSTISKEGIAKKVLIILFVLAGAVFNPVFAQATGQTGVRLDGIMALGFSVSEFLSIAENLAMSGITLPFGVNQILAQVRAANQPPPTPLQVPIVPASLAVVTTPADSVTTATVLIDPQAGAVPVATEPPKG